MDGLTHVLVGNNRHRTKNLKLIRGDKMKNLVMTLAMVLIGSAAHASMVEEYSANLNSFNFQKDSVLSLETEGQNIGGTIDVEPVANITLTLYHSIKCEVGHVCSRVAYAPIVYQVPAKSVKTGKCGEKVYTGFTDERTVDGVLTQITVVDNTHNKCEYFRAIPATEVKMMIEGGRQDLNEYHVMTGERLAEIQ